MNYIPNTDADRAAMLAAVGVPSLAELFQDVPEKFRFPVLDLPPGVVRDGDPTRAAGALRGER